MDSVLIRSEGVLLELRVRHIARNVVFNWFGTVATMAAGFFLAPFVLHRLGDVAVGVWMLTVSVVSYLSLLDLGMQSSVLRFVSKGYTQGDHAGASAAMSAALWVRLQISAVALLLSIGLAATFPLFFKVPVQLASDARKAVLLVGLSTAVTMSLGVFGGILSALNRYDLQNYVTLVQTAIRVSGVVIALLRGHGIVAIAVCELVAVIASNLLLIIIARRLYPELRVRLNRPEREILGRLWTYSSYVFLSTVAVRLVYQTDNLVVGAFISAAAVTPYAYANSLCRYADALVTALALTLVPAASTYEAAGAMDKLVLLYKHGTRATLALSLPITITLLLRGATFIRLWIGPEYAHTSGTVLFILTVGLMFSFANRTAMSVAYGIEKHKTGAIWAIGEGVVNLVLSVVLVHKLGLFGVALGTLIPSLIAQLILWPSYISELVGLSYVEVIRDVWAPLFLAAVPFAVATYAVEIRFPAQSLAVFFVQVIATLPVFMMALALAFRGYVRYQVLPAIRSFVRQ